jgi:hypothetical protein
MKFDLTINLGHVLTITGVIFTMVIGWTNFDARLSGVEKTLATSQSALLEQVRQGARLDAMEHRLNRLEAR